MKRFPAALPPTKALAVVPALNESASIERVISELRAHAPTFDILVVDDGSTDDTAARARSAGAHVIQLPFNLGIGGAVQTGYRFALARGYDLVVQIDGDGQHDPRHVADLVAFLDRNPGVDMVSGTRFTHAVSEGYRSSAPRRMGIGILARIVSKIVDRRVSDPTSGMRMTRRKAISLFACDYPVDYPEVEAIMVMHAHRLQCAEIPVEMRPRLTGVSSITTLRSVHYMATVLLALLVGPFRPKPTTIAS
jgi:glycosyltransferase involved in cell wall biosynthesis